ncbi:MAG: OsmC family protein [Acholeplasmataceae bacterium]
MKTYLNEITITSHSENQGYTTSSTGFKVPIKDATHQTDGTSAGELVAMSLATCLHATLHVLMKAKRLTLESRIDVRYRSYKEDTPSLGFYFELLATIHLPGLNDDDAQALVSRTKELCPVSKMLTQYPHVSIELKT